jgi:hypothetical protein
MFCLQLKLKRTKSTLILNMLSSADNEAIHSNQTNLMAGQAHWTVCFNILFYQHAEKVDSNLMVGQAQEDFSKIARVVPT